MTRCVYLHVLRRVPRRPPRRSARRTTSGDELVEHHLAEVQDDTRTRRRGGATTRRRDAHAGRTRATGSSRRRCGCSVAFSLVHRPAERARHREVHRVVRAALRVSRARARRVRGRRGPSSRWSSRCSASALSYALLLEGLGPQRLTRAQPRRRTPASSSSSTSTTSTCLYDDVIVAFDQGPDRAALRTGSTSTSSTTSSTTPAGARCARAVTYDYIDQKGVDGVVNGIGISTGEAGGAVRQIQTGRLQFYAFMLVLGGGRVRPRARGSRLSGGNQLDGMVGMGTEPRGLPARGRRSHRDAHPPRARGADQVGHAPHDAGDVRRRRRDPRRLRLRPSARPPVRRSTTTGSTSSTAATTSASTASRCRCSRCRRSSRCCASSTRGTTSPSRTTRRRSSR